MSCMASPASCRRVDQISRPTTDNCSSRTRQASKCNCQEPPRGSNDVGCSSRGSSTKRPSTDRNARRTTSNWRHHIHRKRTANRQKHKFQDCKDSKEISSSTVAHHGTATHQLRLVPIGVICLHSFVNGL